MATVNNTGSNYVAVTPNDTAVVGAWIVMATGTTATDIVAIF